MLTLKAPIQLHSALGLTSDAEGFSRRILGNYDLMQAKFTPKDLLFLLTAPPELPEELGGMTTLVTQNNQIDQQSVTLDVVNNVINRILLDGTNQFTYQDQVYITTVLDRLGITNVEQFMAQVRQLRWDTENTFQLTRLYREELQKLILQQSRGEEVPALPLAPEGREEERARPRDPMGEMTVTILQRLNSAQVSRTVHAFQRSQRLTQKHLHHNELRLAEHLRLSTAVDLTQLKQQFYQDSSLELSHHINQYEVGALLAPPATEGQVLSQAAVAALVSAVDNTVTEVLHRPQLFRENWMYLEQALWQTAENTVARFEHYHSEAPAPAGRGTDTLRESFDHYTREVGDFLTLYRTLHAKELREGRIPPSQGDALEQLIHLTRQEGDLFVEYEGDRVEITPGQRVQILRQALAPTPPVPRREERLERERLYHRETAVPREEEDLLPGQEVAPGREHSYHQMEERLRETLLRQQSVLVEHDSTQKLTTERELVPAPAPRAGEDRITLPQLSGPAREEESVVLTPVELTPLQAEEQAPEVLLETLEQIDQHNRTVLQSVRQELQKKEQPAPAPVPDIRGTMRDALRALDDPGEVLDRIPSRQEEVETIHAILTPQEEALLSRADPAARELYERVLLYQKAPEVALSQGLIRPSNLGALQAELRQAARAEEKGAEEQPPALGEVLRPLEEGARQLSAPPPAPGQLQTIHHILTPQEEELLRSADPAAWAVYQQNLIHLAPPRPAPPQPGAEQGERGASSAPPRRETIPAAPLPDIRDTMRDALRALDDPAGVLSQIPERPAVDTVHTIFTPREEELIRGAEPAARELYERVLLYQKAPEAALALGLVRESTLGQLQGEIRRTTREREVALEHLDSLREREQVESQTLLETIQHRPGQVRQVDTPPPEPQAMRMVHKQLPPDVTEELMERLEEQRQRTKVVTESSSAVTRQSVQHTDLTQVERQTVRQTTEDITELVNRTLARQMKTISDQVYRQMERRLQTERSRRGRF